MPEIGIILDREPAWPDLAEKMRRGKVIHITGKFDVTALPGGMQSGRASVAFRFDLPDGRAVIVETSLRSLWNAAVALATRHGESHMQPQAVTDTVRQLQIANAHLARQLLELQVQSGREPKIDLTAADVEWEAEQKARAAGNHTARPPARGGR